MTRGTQIVAAIAQQPFWWGETQFTTVKPLAVLANTRLEPVLEGDYPNRALCWWMIKGISPLREVVPGRLIVGQVEEADKFDPQDMDKDKYQLAWESVKLGGPKNLIEIIEAPPGLAPRDLVNRSGALKTDHAPTSMILVRIGEAVYGPFKADYEPRGRSFVLSLERPQLSDQTSVLDWAKVSADSGFLSLGRVSVAADDRPLNKSTELLFARYQLLLWGRFEALQAESPERIRLYSDKEIVRRAANKVLSKKRLRDFMQAWDDIRDVYLAPQTAQEEADAAQVFAALDARLQGECDSVEALVAGVVASGALSDRLDAAIAQSSKEYVESRSASLDAEIAESVAVRQQKAEELRRTLQQLENELDRKRRQEEASLQADLARTRREFEDWREGEQAAIERERAEIDSRRNQLEHSLNAAATRFADARESLVTDFLSLSPFLRQLGALGGPGNEHVGRQTALDRGVAESVEPPAFLGLNGGKEGLLDEQAFFERFVAHVEHAGFRYKRMDLLAFHLSVKCGDLTVLGGLSGTGKSSLPVLYCQALAGDLNRYLRVDVSPAWLEPGDLLGRANLLEQRFQPSPTAVFQTLVWAATEFRQVGKDSPIWVLCLDEMNLAQPEHYFSGFLQALPHAGEQRSVGVFSESAVRFEDPWRGWHRVPLGPNLRFVGTVNFDETTKPLSQRLLDRSNQLYFESPVLGSLQRGASTDVTPPDGAPVTVASMEDWIQETPLTGKAAGVIDELQGPLAVLGAPLTPRRFQAISRFVASANGLCTPEEAFDMQLRQRVLSQIRGLFRPEARQALDSVRRSLESHGAAFAGAVRMLERIRSEHEREIDFESFEGVQ